jgi:hypothetical protein
MDCRVRPGCCDSFSSYSRVNDNDTVRIIGAASKTTGSTIAQAISHDPSQ